MFLTQPRHLLQHLREEKKYVAQVEVSSYVYAPLSEPRAIRVATLLPGEGTDPLQVLIREQDLDDKSLQYEAVSYCWGEVDRDFQNLCRGRAIMVTQNLTAALLRFRYPTRRRILWTDTICIDQSAVCERNYQVKFMGEIY
jgi:hypothetical protein